MDTNSKEKDQKKPETLQLRAGLYCVATPIGNLRDISMRALDVLKTADAIFCEDTRVTKKLLSFYQITARLHRYNDHSDENARDGITQMIQQGKSVALVSDAGMPLISDPGYKLICDCQREGLYITTIPGANAPLCALQLSGLPSDKFCFLGFMPAKSSARRKMLSEWDAVKASLIAFETAPRLVASLEDIAASLGNREVAVVREITKLYEEARRGNVEDLISAYKEEGQPKGEIVLVIAPAEDKELSDDELLGMLRDALSTMKVKQAASFVAEKTGGKKSDLYNMALAIKKENE